MTTDRTDTFFLPAYIFSKYNLKQSRGMGEGGGKIFDIEIPIQLKFRLREFNKRKENFSMEQQNIRCFIQRKIFPRFVND